MSKKVAAVIVGTTGAVIAGVLGYAAYLNKRYDLDLEHLHEDDDDYEDDYDEDEDGWIFSCEDTEEDGAGLDECEDDEFPGFDSDEPHKGRDTDPFSSKDTPDEFGFAPNKGSTADGLSSGMTGGFSGSMADAFSAGATFENMGMPNLTVSNIPMSKESLELWRKFNQSRVKDAQNYMNTCKK